MKKIRDNISIITNRDYTRRNTEKRGETERK